MFFSFPNNALKWFEFGRLVDKELCLRFLYFGPGFCFIKSRKIYSKNILFSIFYVQSKKGEQRRVSGLEPQLECSKSMSKTINEMRSEKSQFQKFQVKINRK